MGIYANTAGPSARHSTKRLRRTAIWFAALWPASLHPGFGGTWRTRGRRGRHRLQWRAVYGLAFCLANLLPATLTPDRWGRRWRLQRLGLLPWPLDRRFSRQAERRPSAYAAHGWRRHLREGALAAAIVMGISAIAALALFRPGEAGTPQSGGIPSNSSQQASGGAPARDGSYGAPGATLVSFQFGASGAPGSDLANLDGPLTSETVDHALSGSQGDDNFRQGAPNDGPTPNHLFGADFGGGGAGGSASDAGGSGRGSSPSDGPPSSDPGKPGQQTDLYPPQAPGGPYDPPYIMDPDDGPRPSGYQPHDRPGHPTLTELPLSAVPEPQTWLMMIFGFGALGLRLRVKRNRFAGRPTRANGAIG